MFFAVHDLWDDVHLPFGIGKNVVFCKVDQHFRKKEILWTWPYLGGWCWTHQDHLSLTLDLSTTSLAQAHSYRTSSCPWLHRVWIATSSLGFGCATWILLMMELTFVPLSLLSTRWARRPCSSAPWRLLRKLEHIWPHLCQVFLKPECVNWDGRLPVASHPFYWWPGGWFSGEEWMEKLALLK